MKPAISVRGLGKQYTVNHSAERSGYRTLRESLMDLATAPIRRFRSDRAAGTEEFWAVKDVDFDVAPGDVVGIVGRNGAGKSTLLKLLSQITKPTRGEIRLRGRVVSLLEVGTGFHPELTGRENIYLNGSILGMSKREIAARFDQIVEFSGVEKFLDTPVKRYSSGMYVRLAFSVAAHLDPEILIIDEVLAVGDQAFQSKCLGRIGEVARSGRTVLLVSHNMAAVSNLCSKGIVLDSGRLVHCGTASEAVAKYMESSTRPVNDRRDLMRYRPSWATPLIVSAKLLDKSGRECQQVPLGSDVTVEMEFCAPTSLSVREPVMGVVIHHQTLGTVAGVNTRMTGFAGNATPITSGLMRCHLNRLPFLQGTYMIDVWLGDGAADLDTLAGYLSLNIEATDIYNSGRVPFGHMGAVFLQPNWELIAKHVRVME